MKKIILIFLAAVSLTRIWAQAPVVKMANAVRVCNENAILTAMPVGTVYQFGTGTTWVPPATSTAATPKLSFTVAWTAFPFDPAKNILKELDVQQQAKNFSVTCGGVITIVPAAATTVPPPPPTQTTPIITWATPTAIIAGTALSATQLNATANTSGTFTYSPAVGTVESTAGAFTLSVIFTPTDTTHWTTAKSSVSLTVTPASTGPAVLWTGMLPCQLLATTPVTFSCTLTAEAATAATAVTQ